MDLSAPTVDMLRLVAASVPPSSHRDAAAMSAGQHAHDNATPDDDEGERGEFGSCIGPIPVTVEYRATINAQGTVTGLSVTAIELDCQSVDPSEFSAENQDHWHRTAHQFAERAWMAARDEAAADRHCSGSEA